jgi:hypothetical protein
MCKDALASAIDIEKGKSNVVKISQAEFGRALSGTLCCAAKPRAGGKSDRSAKILSVTVPIMPASCRFQPEGRVYQACVAFNCQFGPNGVEASKQNRVQFLDFGQLLPARTGGCCQLK